MGEHLGQLLDSMGTRDLVEIAILALAIYGILRFLAKTRGSGMIRGLALVVAGLFLVAQVLIAAFDLTELGKVLDYLLTTVLVGMLVIFQPELRRGLVLLGRYQVFSYFTRAQHPIADKLAEAAEGLARQCIGALIAIQRQVDLEPYIETGERIDAELSSPLIQTIFNPRGPLHDGAVILCNGRITAAACQLPLGQPPEGFDSQMGMRHRAAVGLSEETDAVLVVISEETGRISLAEGGRLEPVPRENLSRRLAGLLNSSPSRDTSMTKAA